MFGADSPASFLLRWHRVPKSRWLSFIWNRLFVDAMDDGCSYFYQVNDDLEFRTGGWASSFVSTLQNNNDFGVVAPFDPNVRPVRRLFTQAFVSHRHFRLLGWLFPVEIRDWFTDNWITSVYGPKHSFCSNNIVAVNGAAEQRYVQCGTPPWKKALADAQKVLADAA